MKSLSVALVSAMLITPLAARGSIQARPDGASASSTSATLPSNYLIGPQDMLSIVFWREKDMTVDVVVRPDGKISLPLLNDIEAAGISPEDLRLKIAKAAAKYIKDLDESNVTVVVREIRSRNVYVTGQVNKAGVYPLGDGMTVLQAISVAGGLLEYADASNIVVLRKENGKERSFKFNYKDVMKGKSLEQNIVLLPNDTIVVP